MFDIFSFLRKEKPVQETYPSFGHVQKPPSVKLSTDKLSYRPGDTLLATVDIVSDDNENTCFREPVLLQNLAFEIKGIEKLDPQWLLTDEPICGSKHRRGDRSILESSPTTIVTDVLFEEGVKRTYLIKIVLPKVLPPSYKGTAVRYLYYIGISVQWSVASMENGNSGHHSPKILLPPLEVKTVLSMWMMPTNSGLTIEEPSGKEYVGIVPQSAIQVEIHWKEKNDESDWVRASNILSEIKTDAICQSTQSALQSPKKGNGPMFYEKKIQAQSLTNAPDNSKKPLFHSVSGFGALRKPPPLLIPNSSDYDGGEDSVSRVSETRSLLSAKESIEIWTSNSNMPMANGGHDDFGSSNDEQDIQPLLSSAPSGTYARGRSYNIKINDGVLARFSPRNPDSTYYYGDVIGGVLSFFHHEGQRRCLEISVILEMREVLNSAFIHPSRKNSPIITKVQADYYEVVADMLQTHFLFSIPSDGPPSF